MAMYIVGFKSIFYDRNIRKEILQKTSSDTLIEKISHYRHKHTNPALVNIVGMPLLFAPLIFLVVILKEKLPALSNPIDAILIVLFNLLLQNIVFVYFIKAIKKIKIGKKEKLIFAKETAIMFGAVPDYMFKIGLVISYVLHFIFILKILIR